jgi:hypothetical protein
MTLLILALKLVPLILLCGIAPGLLVVRRLRWSPLEKLCGAVAASFIITYLASFSLFCFNAPPGAYQAVSAVYAVIAILNFRQFLLFFRFHQTRKVLLAFFLVLLWDFLHLCIVRNYSGGTWSSDWNEHYERAWYFLHAHSNDFKYLGSYLLPARPPMMNLICAFIGDQIRGPRFQASQPAVMQFETYSLCCLILNAWAFLPCCLLLRHLKRKGVRNVWVLAILFMLSPSIMANVTFTITKAMSAGFVVLGTCFYLRGLKSGKSSRISDSGNRMFPHSPSPGTPGEGWGGGRTPMDRRNPLPDPPPEYQGRGTEAARVKMQLPCDSPRIAAAALSLAAGILVHYSALPFAAVIALHYLWILSRQRRPIFESLVAAFSATALLFTWFAWSIAVFGTRVTFLSNTTAAGAVTKSLGENARKILLNLFTSLVPHPFHTLADKQIPSIHNWGNLRDYCFMMYQTTLPMMIGSVAGLMALYLLFFRRYAFGGDAKFKSQRSFWLFFVPFSFIFGTATNPDWDPIGVAHITQQALAMMGVALVAAWLLDLRRWLFAIIIFGTAIDYALGVLLEFNRESYIFHTKVDPRLGRILIPDPTLGGPAFVEYYNKIVYRLVFWGDHFVAASTCLQIISSIVAMTALALLIRMKFRQPES